MPARKLAPKQQRFVEEYLVDLSATASAKRAGYSDKTAYSIGWELLRKPEIQDAIQIARNALSVRTQLSQDWVLERWKIEALGEGPDTNSSARNKATEMIAKHFGMLTDKVQVEQTGPPPTINVRFGKPADETPNETQQE